MFPAGFEPATFRVWGERDNRYTTETYMWTAKNRPDHYISDVLSCYQTRNFLNIWRHFKSLHFDYFPELKKFAIF